MSSSSGGGAGALAGAGAAAGHGAGASAILIGAPAGSASAAAIRRARWAHHHRLQQRYKDEHNRDPAWFNHSKHILICSWSGRPIYTRYGDESKLAAYMGVVTALISNFQRLGDALREVRAGVWKFVFLCKGPIYLIAISRTSESSTLLLHQLSYAYLQMVSVLTASVASILEAKPSYDIRNLMGGTESMLADLMDEADSSPYLMLDSIPVLRMPKQLRTRIGSALRRSGMKNLLFGLLLGAGKQLIHIVRGKDRVLHPSDALLLLNFLTQSLSLRSSEESWTPICLPHFSNRGFLYAYVCYLTDDICLTLLTADSNDFANLRAAKNKIVDALHKRGGDCLAELQAHIASSLYHIHLEELEPELRLVMEVKHFLYKSDAHAQIIMCLPQQPFSHSKHNRKWLFRRYQHVLSRIGAATGEIHEQPPSSDGKASSSSSSLLSQPKRHQVYFESSDFANLFCVQRAGEYTLLVAFAISMTDKALIMTASQKILKWIQKEAPNLFI